MSDERITDIPIPNECKNCIFSAFKQFQPKWIPVTERLPEDGQNVLVTVEGWYKGNMFERDVDLATYSPCGGYIDGFDTVNDWIEYGEWKATAWMPLPEPYREEADNAQLD